MKKFRDYKNDKHWDEEKHKEALERREIKNLEKHKEDIMSKADETVKEIADIAYDKKCKQELKELLEENNEH